MSLHACTCISIHAARLLFSLGTMVQSPSPSVSPLTASGTSRLQFTGPSSMYWVIYYAILSRMRMQSQRQTIKQHSAAPLSFHPVLSLPFSNSASSGKYIRYLLVSIFSSTLRYNATSWHGFIPKLSPGSSLRQVPMAWLFCS